MANNRKEAWRGFLLEEIIAYLIMNAGYSLLVDESQDPEELVNKGNGLSVKGRGALHQADALGDLEWIPAFTYPIRLFVEVKYRNGTTDLPVVRNAVGTLLDVNQNNITVFSEVKDGNYPQKHQYCYALFSTSKFTKDAKLMALAHGISLNILDPTDYARILKSLDSAVVTIFSEKERGKKKTVRDARWYLRNNLGTVQGDLVKFEPTGYPELDEVIEEAKKIGELFIGIGKGPLFLLLKPDDRDSFLNYVRQNPVHRINIHWETDNKIWWIEPETAWQQNTYRLTFSLPDSLFNWIFSAGEKTMERARRIKSKYLSAIHIYRRERSANSEEIRLIKLIYDPWELNRKMKSPEYPLGK